MMDSHRNDLTLKEACKRAGVPYSLLKQTLKQEEIKKERAKHEIVLIFNWIKQWNI